MARPTTYSTLLCRGLVLSNDKNAYGARFVDKGVRYHFVWTDGGPAGVLLGIKSFSSIGGLAFMKVCASLHGFTSCSSPFVLHGFTLCVSPLVLHGFASCASWFRLCFTVSPLARYERIACVGRFLICIVAS